MHETSLHQKRSTTRSNTNAVTKNPDDHPTRTTTIILIEGSFRGSQASRSVCVSPTTSTQTRVRGRGTLRVRMSGGKHEGSQKNGCFKDVQNPTFHPSLSGDLSVRPPRFSEHLHTEHSLSGPGLHNHVSQIVVPPFHTRKSQRSGIL